MSIPPPPPAPRYRSAKERAAAIRRLEEHFHNSGREDSYHGSAMRWNSGPTIISAFPLIIR